MNNVLVAASFLGYWPGAVGWLIFFFQLFHCIFMSTIWCQRANTCVYAEIVRSLERLIFACDYFFVCCFGFSIPQSQSLKSHGTRSLHCFFFVKLWTKEQKQKKIKFLQKEVRLSCIAFTLQRMHWDYINHDIALGFGKVNWQLQCSTYTNVHRDVPTRLYKNKIIDVLFILYKIQLTNWICI